MSLNLFALCVVLGGFSVILGQQLGPTCVTSITYESNSRNLTTVLNLTKITVNVGDIFQLSATINYECLEEVFIKPRISYDRVARVLNCTGLSGNGSHFTLPSTTAGAPQNVTLECSLKATRLGGAQFLIYIGSDDDTADRSSVFRNNIELDLAGIQLVVLRVGGILDIIFRVITTCLVIILTYFMGCSLDLKIIINYFKLPIAPVIGFFSQFLFMPLIAFGLSKATGISPEFGFGLLTIGCSPGGGGSNVWTVLLNGDLNLSMTMTFLSTILSIAMMPLWMFALGRFFIDTSRIAIPYSMIVINILQIIIPVLAGIFTRWKNPPLASKLEKATKILAILFVVFMFTFGIYANIWMYELLGDYPALLPIGSCLPWLGFLIGFLIALAFRQGMKRAVTIALETGIQNIGIPILILLYSMPQPQGSMGGIMPIVVAIFTPLPLYIIFIVLFIKRKCCTKKKEAADGTQMVPQAENNKIKDKKKKKIVEERPDESADGLLSSV